MRTLDDEWCVLRFAVVMWWCKVGRDFETVTCGLEPLLPGKGTGVHEFGFGFDGSRSSHCLQLVGMVADQEEEF